MSGTNPSPALAPAAAGGDRWAAARRVEGWAGEVRVNLVRLAALVVFYGYHLVNVYLTRDDPALTGAYHLAVTALAMVWSIGVVVLYLGLARRWAPPALKYAVTAWDVVLATTLVMLAGGPRSPLVVLFFLVVTAAALRLSLRLVYAATLGSITAYLFLLGHYAFFVVGSDRYYADPAVRVPRSQEVILVLALGATGVLAGQVVRQARRLAHGAAAAGEALPYPADVEVRRDSQFVAGGLIGMGVLVGLGLLFAVTHAPPEGRSGAAWAGLAAVSVAFVAAVAAAVAEVLYPAGRTGGGVGRLLGLSAGESPAREGGA